MKKLLWIGIGILALSVVGVQAEEAAAPEATPATTLEKKQPIKPELKTLTIEGTIAKTEKQNKDGKSIVRYTITGDNGSTYNLRVPPRKDLPGANIPELVGCKVKLVGKGKEGKQNIVAVISSIEKLDAAAPVAPPAAPPTTAK